MVWRKSKQQRAAGFATGTVHICSIIESHHAWNIYLNVSVRIHMHILLVDNHLCISFCFSASPIRFTPLHCLRRKCCVVNSCCPSNDICFARRICVRVHVCESVGSHHYLPHKHRQKRRMWWGVNWNSLVSAFCQFCGRCGCARELLVHARIGETNMMVA